MTLMWMRNSVMERALRVRRHATAALLAVCLAALTAPAGAAAEAGDYVIGPQDVLSVTVFDQADLGGKYAVELDGTAIRQAGTSSRDLWDGA